MISSTKRQIELNKRKIDYTLKISKKARRMRLAVYCDGDFVVTAPYSMNQGLIERFIFEKSDWIIKKIEYFKVFGGRKSLKGNREDFLKHKERALTRAMERVKYFNDMYCFEFDKVNIRNQKTRWGSCSRKGNLNFNYRIAFLPDHLFDYIVVHELCHLGQFNHSQRFWDLVARALPDYAELRKELKKNGLSFQ